MLRVDDPATFLKIRDTLLVQCIQVEELERREIVRSGATGTRPTPGAQTARLVLKRDIVSRLCLVLRSLKGRHALAAFQRQTPYEVYVLCVDALVGWKCKCARVPRLDDVEDATLIVTSADLAWTFGMHEKWRRGSFAGGPVFVEPNMLPETLL